MAIALVEAPPSDYTTCSQSILPLSSHNESSLKPPCFKPSLDSGFALGMGHDNTHTPPSPYPSVGGEELEGVCHVATYHHQRGGLVPPLWQ